MSCKLKPAVLESQGFALRNFKDAESAKDDPRSSILDPRSSILDPRSSTLAVSKKRRKFMPAREITSVEELRSLTGREVAVSDWFEITQDRIDLFADATGDHQWIHVDVERAKADSPYGSTIAHGFLTLSLLSQLMSETVKIKLPIKMGVNYGLNKVRFPSAVPAGSKIRARAVLQSLEEVAGGQQLYWNITVERDGGDKPCCVAEWLVRYYTQ
jgi:acyl dehydratase